MAPRKKEDFSEMADASREKILKSAFELFANHGYSRTSVDMIAQKARISKGLIYHYFKSKEEILRGLFIQFVEETNEQILWNESQSPQAALQQLIDFSVHFITGEVKLNRLMISLVLQPDVIKGIKKDMERLREGWWGRLTALLKELGYKDPEAEGYLLGAILDGFGLGYIAMGKEYPVEKVKKLIEKKYGL
ncbi:MAG: TetR/AcrR family transcriptional regulator [Chitinophagaceae bacterium]|nr:MAG: TetR/AcrR family transcriptional regulator [Chitinophagaceae bacterium]